MPAIAGKDVDRRLCPHRVAHVTAAPPQAVTMTPAPQAMATTKFRTLAHRSDGRRHLPRQHRQHHASKRLQAGHPSRRCPAAPLSKTTRTTALTNGAGARRISLGRHPRRTTRYAKRKQASRRQEETNSIYPLPQQHGATVLEVGPANRSRSGTGEADGSAPTCSGTVRRACAENHSR